MFFANAELFDQRVMDAVAASPTPARRVVVSAAPITSVDVTSADALVELDRKLADQGIELCFAELKDPVKDKLKRFGLVPQIGEMHFFPTIKSAVKHHLKDAGIEWSEQAAQ